MKELMKETKKYAEKGVEIREKLKPDGAGCLVSWKITYRLTYK